MSRLKVPADSVPMDRTAMDRTAMDRTAMDRTAMDREEFRKEHQSCLKIPGEYQKQKPTLKTNVDLQKHYKYLKNLSGSSGDIVVLVEKRTGVKQNPGSKYRILKYMQSTPLPGKHKVTQRRYEEVMLHEIQTMCLLSSGQHFPQIYAYGSTCNKAFPAAWLKQMDKDSEGRGSDEFGSGHCGAFVEMEYLEGYIELAELDLQQTSDETMIKILLAIYDAVNEGTKMLGGFEFDQTDMHPRNILIKMTPDNELEQLKLIDFSTVEYPEGLEGHQALHINVNSMDTYTIEKINRLIFTTYLVRHMKLSDQKKVLKMLRMWGSWNVNRTGIAIRVIMLKFVLSMHNKDAAKYLYKLITTKPKKLDPKYVNNTELMTAPLQKMLDVYIASHSS